jgi:hypothetical protein
MHESEGMKPFSISLFLSAFLEIKNLLITLNGVVRRVGTVDELATTRGHEYARVVT